MRFVLRHNPTHELLRRMLYKLFLQGLENRSASRLLHLKRSTSSSEPKMVRHVVRLFRHEQQLDLQACATRRCLCQILCRYVLGRKADRRIVREPLWLPLTRIARNDQIDAFLLALRNTQMHPSFRLRLCANHLDQDQEAPSRNFACQCHTARQHRNQ